MKLNTHFSPLFISFVTLALVACGGSGGSGSDDDRDNDGIIDSRDIDDDNDDLIEIASLEQLDWMRNNLSGTVLESNDGSIFNQGCASTCNGYELTVDLDFDTNGDSLMDAGDTYFDYDGDGSNNGWLPIGDFDSPFSAIFEGNGHTISNLFIERGSSDAETGGEYIGLFGSVRYTEIRNLVMDGDLMDVTGDRFTGGIAGRSVTSATVSNVTTSGTVTSTGELTGGLMGASIESTISDSHATGVITGVEGTGGLVGRAVLTSIIDSSVSATVTGDQYTGGLVGLRSGYSDAPILRSHMSGTVMGNDYTGGLAGLSDGGGAILYSYNTGPVTGGNYTGGLVGSANFIQGVNPSTLPLALRFVFATGTVTTDTNDYVGGLIGIAFHIQLERCFATNTVANSGLYVGGLVGDANTGAEVTRCFAANEVEGLDHVGAIIGWSDSGSYANNWFANDNGLSDGIGTNVPFPASVNDGMSGDTLSALQSATSPGENGVFTLFWDGDTWDFGTASELPGLNYDDGIYRDGDADGQLD